MTPSREALVNALKVLLLDWTSLQIELEAKETIDKEYLDIIKLNISHMDALIKVVERELLSPRATMVTQEGDKK